LFSYTLLHWVTFFSAAILLNLSPGPDIAFILGQTAKHGRRGGFAAMYGVWTGAFGHVVMAAVGLSAILVASALAFTAIKWIGAAYLVYLGLKSLFSRGSVLSPAQIKAAETSRWSIFRQGLIVSALNPKVATFFLAFLPQFVVKGAGPVSAQLFLHGSLIIVVAAFIEPLYVLSGSWLAKALRNNKRLSVWMDRSLGALFIALGIKLATSK